MGLNEAINNISTWMFITIHVIGWGLLGFFIGLIWSLISKKQIEIKSNEQ